MNEDYKRRSSLLIIIYKFFLTDEATTFVEEDLCLILCNTPVLTPFALGVYDVYIVIDRGVELKAKAPPLIWLCCVSAIEIIVDGIL